MLICFNANVLQCYCAVMLLCCNANVLLQCYCAAMLMYCYSAIVLQVFCATVLQCLCATVLLYCNATVLQCYCAAVLCAAVLLCCSANVLQCYYAAVLLCCSASVVVVFDMANWVFHCIWVYECYIQTDRQTDRANTRGPSGPKNKWTLTLYLIRLDIRASKPKPRTSEYFDWYTLFVRDILRISSPNFQDYYPDILKLRITQPSDVRIQ